MAQPCCMPEMSDGSTRIFVIKVESFVKLLVCFFRLRLSWLAHCGALAAAFRGCERVRAAARPLEAASALLFSRTARQNSLKTSVRTAHVPEHSQSALGK